VSVRYRHEPVENISLVELFTIEILDFEPKFYPSHFSHCGFFSGIWLTSTKPASTAL